MKNKNMKSGIEIYISFSIYRISKYIFINLYEYNINSYNNNISTI